MQPNYNEKHGAVTSARNGYISTKVLEFEFSEIGYNKTALVDKTEILIPAWPKIAHYG